MWIVKLALRRPYTFVVMSLLIAILGCVTMVTMSTDIFPNINIPIVSVIWTYNGVSPDEMEKRISTVSERSITTTVNDIEHMESQSLNGVSVIRIYFQPTAKVELAVGQLASVSQAILRVLPPGAFPPAILKYNASSVPILQVGISSKTLSEAELYDYGTNFIRTQLATVQGASVPLPYGGKPRQIMVDLDPGQLYARHLSATDVSNAINLQNLVLPAGTAKIGDREYNIRLNSSPEVLAELNDLPIKQVNGATVYIKDVAQVRDGFAVQQNIVRKDGSRSTLLQVIKNGSSSTLDIVSRVKQQLKKIQAGLPPELELTVLFDQSIFVRAAANGVVREGVIAAVLTGLMILLFLGSWRSTLIVCISIPLSIITSLLVLYAFGETINVMTLGGLALAVGILVDDATVEIENIHRNMAERKPITRAILDGAQQIAVPAFVSTLAICIVFVPVVFLTGTAKYLFTPLAEAVVFAMLASYFLSRTLVPTMVKYLLRSEAELYANSEGEHAHGGRGIIWKIHYAFNDRFEDLRNVYHRGLIWTLDHRLIVVGLFGIFALCSIGLAVFVGEDFFPAVDAGQFRMHVRTPTGTRIEQTERRFAEVEDLIRSIVPHEELNTILDNIGLPPGGVNLAFSDSGTVGNGDGEILVALQKEHHPTAGYVKRLRQELKQKFPDLVCYFQPADITSQILNFGLPAPIDVQLQTRNAHQGFEFAQMLEAKIAKVPGAVDVHVNQIVDYPEVNVKVDRTKADLVGLSQRDVANSLLLSLSGSGQVAPNFWLNPANGVNYFVAVQTPQRNVDTFAALQATPISSASGNASPQLLSNLSTLQRHTAPAIISHYNVQPVFDVYAAIQGRDLGGVARDIRQIVDSVKLPRGMTAEIRGQVQTMNSSFIGLGLGLIFAILLVYLLMVVNFQSWLDPFIILMSLPGALSGIIWMLFATGTTLNVPSLMGAIMSIGVATANSILLVTFANSQRMDGTNAHDAALSAGFIRLRPVMMTALAMIIGMLPMSLGIGEGGEQNAPLGRAVIGGLLFATLATLFIVPSMYSLLRKKQPLDLDLETEDLEYEIRHH